MARHDKPYSVLLGIVFQPVFFLKNWELSMGTLESSKPHWRNMANFFHLGGGFKHFLLFSPLLAEDSHFDHFSSDDPKSICNRGMLS